MRLVDWIFQMIPPEKKQVELKLVAALTIVLDFLNKTQCSTPTF